jgi:hypothetical protein
MEGESRRTSKEIAEEIRRGEREYEQCLAEEKAEILAMEKELFELQKKTILDTKALLMKQDQDNIVPEYVKLNLTIKTFKRHIEPE